MKQIFTLFSFILCISFTQAQTTSAVFPTDGTQLEIISCNHIDPLTDETGPNAIWDYSGLSGCEEIPWTITFHDAEGSAEAENFPNANKYLEIAIPPSTKVQIYSNVNDTSWSVFGAKYNNAYIHCDGGEPILQFPAALDDTWTFDNSWANPYDTIPSMPIYSIDGEGTLILPNATYENVIRVHSVRPDAVGLFTEETFTYYSPDYQYHLFHMLVNDESQYQPNPIKVLTSTHEITDTKSINIFPNPSSGHIGIDIELDVSSKSVITLFSSLAENIFSKKEVVFTNGNYYLELDSKLETGIYFIQIVANGLRYTSKLIIQ